MRQNTVVSRGHYGTFYIENTVASTNVVQPGAKGRQLDYRFPQEVTFQQIVLAQVFHQCL